MKFKIIALTIITVFVFYGVFKSRDIFFGSPVEFSLEKASTSRMRVEGKAKNSKEILINGDKTYTNMSGDFLYDFSPLPGLNVVTIETKDSFGNRKEKVYSFVYNNEQGTKTAQR